MVKISNRVLVKPQPRQRTHRLLTIESRLPNKILLDQVFVMNGELLLRSRGSVKLYYTRW